MLFLVGCLALSSCRLMHEMAFSLMLSATFSSEQPLLRLSTLTGALERRKAGFVGAALKALQSAIVALPGIKTSDTLEALLSLAKPKEPLSAVSQKASVSPVAERPMGGLRISKRICWLQYSAILADMPV